MDDFSSMYMDFSSSSSYAMGLQDINNINNHQQIDFGSSDFLQDSTKQEEKVTIKAENTFYDPYSSSSNTFDFLSDTNNHVTPNISEDSGSSCTLENLLETGGDIQQLTEASSIANLITSPLKLPTNQTLANQTQENKRNPTSVVYTTQSQNISGVYQPVSKNLCKVQIVKRVNGIATLSNGKSVRIIQAPNVKIIGNKPIQVLSAMPAITVPTPHHSSDVINKTTPEPLTVQQEVKMEDLKINISNVVASFKVCCHLNLRKIALEGINVVYRRETKKIVMRVRNPSCTAYVWSSGRIVCTGAGSEALSRKAARKFARRLQKLGFEVTFAGFKVINVLAVCRMPFAIDITEFSKYYRSKFVSYEPELHPAVTYRMPETKVSLKIFSTGSITLTSPNVENVRPAIEKLLPLLLDFFKYDVKNPPSGKTKAVEHNSEDDS